MGPLGFHHSLPSRSNRATSVVSTLGDGMVTMVSSCRAALTGARLSALYARLWLGARGALPRSMCFDPF